MGQYYNLIEYKPFREPWASSHGSEMQTYFGKIEGVEQSVMINKKVGNTPRLGANYGSLETKPDKDYLKFNGQQPPPGTTIPDFKVTQASQANQPAPQATGGNDFQAPAWFIPYGNMITAMHKSMGLVSDGKIEGVEQKHQSKPLPVTPEEKARLDGVFNDTVPEEVDPLGDINLDDIPF
jgi:hypothetical protein